MANINRPDRTNRFENNLWPFKLMVFSQSNDRNANAGIWARLDKICSVTKTRKLLMLCWREQDTHIYRRLISKISRVELNVFFGHGLNGFARIKNFLFLAKLKAANTFSSVCFFVGLWLSCIQ